VSRFFFDADDGHQFIPDGVGQELESVAAAKAAAQAALTDATRNAVLGGDQRTFIVSVRDDARQVVLTIGRTSMPE
jgi:hypothetical protein